MPWHTLSIVSSITSQDKPQRIKFKSDVLRKGIHKDEYDAHIKKNKPALHAKLVKMRRDYLEMEPKNSQASNFIGELYKTARLVRRKVMDAPTEAKT
ncbi:hypothetical protein COOONC_03717 [Cooperia oncophora]